MHQNIWKNYEHFSKKFTLFEIILSYRSIWYTLIINILDNYFINVGEKIFWIKENQWKMMNERNRILED